MQAVGVSAGMSVISMIEVIVFIYIILNGIFIDILNLWRRIFLCLNGNKINQNLTSDLESTTMNEEDVEGNDILDDEEQEFKKIYVSINFR